MAPRDDNGGGYGMAEERHAAPEFPAGPAPPELAASLLRHLDSAHNLARWLLRDASAAEDVVQDAMLRALRHAGAWRGGDPRAWLLGIVRNAALDRLRVRGRERPWDDDWADSLPDPAPGPEDRLLARE